MEIEKIVVVPRTGLYRLVFVGGEKFDVDVASIAEHRLTKGLVLTLEAFEALKQHAAYLYWLNKCLNKLARRPQSSSELTRFLQSNRVDPVVVDKVSSYLLQQKYVDDSQFAEWFIKSSHRKLKSVTALSYELQQKGILRSIIAEKLAEQNSEDTETLKQLIRKKQSQSRYKDEVKLKQFLMRKGFSYDTILHALREINEN